MLGRLCALTMVCAAFASPSWAQEAPAAADAPGLSVTLTNDFEYRYRIEDQRLSGFEDRAIFNYVEQVNRLNIFVGKGPWSVLTQIDEVVLFANRYRLDGDLLTERQLVVPGVFSPLPGDSYATIEKLAFAWTKPSVTVKLGDFYGAFGRGVALNVARNVDIDIDTSIQGAHLLVRTGPWDLTLLVGQLNRQQIFQDNPNLGIEGDYRHAVAGLRVERFGLGPANLGIHGIAYDFVEEWGWGAGFSELGTTPDAVIGGASVELMGVAGLDWAVEADGFFFPTDVLWGGDSPSPGLAVYASTVAYIGRTTWQLEGKRYKDAERINSLVGPELYEVAVAPSLEYERAITEDSSATVNSNDVWGTRLRMDWTAVPGVAIPYVSVGVFRDLELGGLHFNAVPETVVHSLLGIEVFGEDVTVIANTGLRYDDRDGNDAGADRQVHGDLDLKFPLVADFHVDLAAALELYHWGENPLQQADYAETEVALSVLKGSGLALTAFTDFSSNPLVDSTGNLGEDVYAAVELQVKPSPAWTIKGFYGAYKAGIRCSGGQCRLLPGFEGARFAVSGTL